MRYIGEDGYYCLVVAILKNGISVDEAIHIFEYGEKPIQQRLRKSSSKSRKQMHKDIVKAHSDGYSLRMIAKMYGVDKSTVCRFLKEERKKEVSEQMSLFG